jgi:hypothetical protein
MLLCHVSATNVMEHNMLGETPRRNPQQNHEKQVSHMNQVTVMTLMLWIIKEAPTLILSYLTEH